MAYLPMLAGASFLVWDDSAQIINNLDLRLGLSAIGKIFSTFYLDMYQPLTTLSYWLDIKLWGYNALAFHLVSLGLHLLNCYLVFKLLRKLNFKKELAVASCLFFALWPTQVEAAAWLSARSTLLSATGILLTLLLYLRYLSTSEKKYYWLSLLCYLAGLLAKVSVAGMWLLLPLLLLGQRRQTWRDWAKASPFALLSIALLAWAAVGRHLAGQPLSAEYSSWYLPFYAYSLLSSALRVAWPFRLSPLYPFPGHTLAIIALISLISLAAYTLWGYIQKKPWSFWLAWLLVCLAPSAAITPRLITITGDRYAYLAGLPILIFFVWLLSRLKQPAKYLCLGLVLAAAAWGTINYAAAWTDDRSLWDYAVASQPRHCWTWYTRGYTIMVASGFPAALPDFRRAGDLCSRDQQMSDMISRLFLDNRRFNEALVYLRNSLAAREQASTHHNIAMAYLGLKQTPAACREIGIALAQGLKPDPAIKKYCPLLKY